MRLTIPCLALVLGIASQSAAAQNVTQEVPLEEVVISVMDRLSPITLPKAIDQPKPKYPSAMRARSNEAWVVVEYTVGIDGKPHSTVITDTSDKDQSFNEAAIQAVSQWRYEPARKAGVAIEYPLQSRMVFRITGTSTGARLSFMEKIREFDAAFNAGEVETAKAILENTEHQGLRLYELAHYFFRLGIILEDGGDPDAALRAYGKGITSPNATGDDIHAALKLRIMDLQIRQGHVSAAVATYRGLLKLNDRPSASNPIMVKARALRKSIEGAETEWEVRGALTSPCSPRRMCSPDQGSWHYTINGRSIRFNEVEGTVDRAQIICDAKLVEGPVTAETTWTIPQDWKNCSLRVLGTEGARLSISDT